MSKKQSSNIGGFSQPVRILHDYLIPEIEGQLLTFIESLGLSQSQEKAAKDIFRTIYYRFYNDTNPADGLLSYQAVDAYRKSIATGTPHIS